MVTDVNCWNDKGFVRLWPQDLQKTEDNVMAQCVVVEGARRAGGEALDGRRNDVSAVASRSSITGIADAGGYVARATV